MIDNGKQFDNPTLKEMCQELGIHKLFSTPGHPQANEQVEAANKIIKDNLKKKLEQLKGAWVDELPMVLWAYHTTPKEATRETPFSLVFGPEELQNRELHRTRKQCGLTRELGFPRRKAQSSINPISSP